MHHPLPNHQQGGMSQTQGLPTQTFAAASQQTRAPNQNAWGPPNDRFNNMSLDNMTFNNGMQKTKMASASPHGEMPVIHEGWRFRKAPGEKKWTDIIKLPMPLERAELLNIVRKMRNKHTVDEQYSGLRSKSQRMQIDLLLEEKRLNEKDPEAEWVLACVKDVHSKTNNGWGPDETTELQVILKRHGRQKRASKNKTSKGVTSVLNPPGQRVSLHDTPNASKAGAGNNTSTRPVQPPAHQLNDAHGNNANGSTRAPLPGGQVSLQNGVQGPQHGPPMSSAAPPPLNPPQAQNAPRIFQGLPPKALQSGGRPMNEGPGPRIDFYDPNIPIIEAPPPAAVKPVPQPQARQRNFAGNANVNGSGNFQDLDSHRRKQSPRTQPRQDRYDRRRDSSVMFDDSDGYSPSEGTRYSFDDSRMHSPLSLPTTINSRSPRRKGSMLLEDEYFEAPRRRFSRGGHQNRHGRRSRHDQIDYPETGADLMPQRRDDWHSPSRHPHPFPARPRYKERISPSRDIEGALERLEGLRRDEQDKYERARRAEEAYEREWVVRGPGRDYGGECDHFRRDDGRVRGVSY